MQQITKNPNIVKVTRAIGYKNIRSIIASWHDVEKPLCLLTLILQL